MGCLRKIGKMGNLGKMDKLGEVSANLKGSDVFRDSQPKGALYEECACL
jgi:hypothetical protein